ncbi:two-component system sensor histidine kinase NtrB [Alkalihalobacterium chitinilyticum]|uniref:histidine kinase n=1 Tax=Alkalihalobacterium chitinilyticum TaxID=2980103 RepID=A0ABT5VDD8_9BACI|nr:ATP-binding protein [Alkalihalobacterium chitinilyticum]MDE5413342.1 ATP-binding protein [Alkalihalobacterium chitinilyticum]
MLKKGLANSDIQRILNALPFGVLIVDAKGEFLHINSKVYDIWGVDPAKWDKHTVYGEYEGYYKGTDQRISKGDWAVIRAIEKGETSFGEVIDIQTFDGRKATILNSAIPLFTAGGRIDGAVLTISDITEVKQLEIELNIHKRYLSDLVEEKTRELKEKNEKLKQEMLENERLHKEKRKMDQLHLVGEMAVGFAHEIRNRMTTVNMFLQFLSTTDLSDQEKKQMISTVLLDVEQANAIISEFVMLSHNKKVELRPNNLNKIVRESILKIQTDLEINTSRFIFINEDSIPDICVDENEITQLIMNLIRNGLEAMEDDQVLTIKTLSNENEILLLIKDEGPGIHPSILDKIATPFFTTKDHHIGLGLSKCYSIAERNQATITLDTGATGTTVTVTFLNTSTDLHC